MHISLLGFGIDRSSKRMYCELKVYKNRQEYKCYASAVSFDYHKNALEDLVLEFSNKDKTVVNMPFDTAMFNEINQVCLDQMYAIADAEILDKKYH